MASRSLEVSSGNDLSDLGEGYHRNLRFVGSGFSCKHLESLSGFCGTISSCAKLLVPHGQRLHLFNSKEFSHCVI